METTNNLPSLFRSLRTSCHSPLISTAELERLILHDKALENDTKGYREAINIDRNEARNKKRRLPAICPSIQFRRTGRKLEDFGCATGWLMLDYDHVAGIVLDEKVELASKSPYSMVVYRTISGKGLRILLRYERPKGCTLTVTELHHLAVDKAISIYDDLLHISADQQCKDMVRLCGLAHDAKAYFCWDSKPLTFTPDEVNWFYQHVVLKEQEKEEAADKAVRKNAEKNRAKSNATKGGTPTFEAIIQRVEDHARNWRVQFQPGSHHEYCMRFAGFCHSYGADKEQLLNWMLQQYGSQYDGIKSIVTKPTITLRRPYARYSSQLLHNASLCGTSNNIHIISEQETRRYLVWEVERIQSPRETPIDYRHLYAQALALGQKVMKEKTLSAASDGEEEPWVYWLTPKDISHLEVHNRLFIVNNYMEELIQKYYRVPNPDSDIHSPNLKFVTSAEILEHIAGNPVFRPSFSTRNVGDVMTHLGYSKTRRNNSHGWWVVEKEGVTIAADSRFIENKDEL